MARNVYPLLRNNLQNFRATTKKPTKHIPPTQNQTPARPPGQASTSGQPLTNSPPPTASRTPKRRHAPQPQHQTNNQRTQTEAGPTGTHQTQTAEAAVAAQRRSERQVQPPGSSSGCSGWPAWTWRSQICSAASRTRNASAITSSGQVSVMAPAHSDICCSPSP